LSALTVSYFVLAPVDSVAVWDGIVPLAAFVGVALLITWIDVQRRRAEDALDGELAVEHEGRGEAEAVNRATEGFFATISHELNGPLNAIVTWVRVLQTGKLDQAAAQHALETVARNAQAEARLIKEMLEVSRTIAGKVCLDIGPLELAPLLEQAVESALPAAEEKGVQVDVTLARAQGTIRGDSDRLAQVVRNLLSNAIKFTPRGGHVMVQLEGGEQQGPTITVSDTGQGILPDFLPYVFDRFRQSGSLAVTRTDRGLGLGLTIVRDLVELHGGTVRAESGGEGQGARFTVTLPAGERDRQRAAPLALMPRKRFVEARKLAGAHATW
jgi:signal transduction histidine kinase